MSNKLQELTDRLYNEGLSKGKEEGELLLAKAHKEAESIISDAKAQAESIIAAAEQSASELKSKAESDIKMASEQSLVATRKEIEELLVHSCIDSRIAKETSDATFLKKIITEVASHFSASEATDINLILPENLKAELEAWVQTELSKLLSKGVEATFSKKINGGFSIGPKGGSWYISLSDESFQELIAAYMRPITKKLLFG